MVDFYLDEPLSPDADDNKYLFDLTKSLFTKFDTMPYAQAEAASINCESRKHEFKGPLTCAIYGSWGSGKTSFLRYMQKHFEENSITVWFEPWRYETENQLLVPMLIEIQSAMQGKINNDKAKRAAMNTGKKLIGNVVRGSLRAAGTAIEKTVGVNPYEIGEEFYKQYSQLDDQWERSLSEVQQFKSDLRALVDLAGAKAYRQDSAGKTADRAAKKDLNRWPLVIFIDDLDRCDPTQVRRLIESIKLFMHEPGIYFFMALDELQVMRAMGEPFVKYYADADNPADRARSQAKQYLEKFFQYSVDVTAPSMKEKLGIRGMREKILGTLLGLMYPDDDWSEESVKEQVKQLFAQVKENPRALKGVARWIYLNSDDLVTAELAGIVFEHNWVDIYTRSLLASSPEVKSVFFRALNNLLCDLEFNATFRAHAAMTKLTIRVLYHIEDEPAGVPEDSSELRAYDAARLLAGFSGVLDSLQAFVTRNEVSELEKLRIVSSYAAEAEELGEQVSLLGGAI